MWAALYAALRKHSHGASRDLDHGSGDLDGELDENGDDVVSTQEIKYNLKRLSVQLDILLQRLELETKMTQMIVKLPNFFLGLISFVIGLYILSPAADINAANRRLTEFFGVTRSDLEAVTTISELYDFAEQFQSLNEEMMPESSQYWCESRYIQLDWDNDLNVPKWTCNSPRLHALGLLDDNDAAKWSALDEDSLAAAAATDDCVDNNTMLHLYRENQTENCGDDPVTICDTLIAVAACKKTCGYCGPFTYQRRKAFNRPQATLLPIIIHQSRMALRECTGFAKTFANLPYNTELIDSPTLDGERAEGLVKCVDPDTTLDDDYEDGVACPDSVRNTEYCVDGVFRHSKKVMFDDKPIYPKVVRESRSEIARMRAADWLDIQTKEVVISTLAYAQLYELFTYVSTTFTIDSAGHITGTTQTVSYRDLGSDTYIKFIVAMSICLVSCISGIAYPLWKVIRYRYCSNRLVIYEVVSRALLGLFCIATMVKRGLATPMAELYEELLDTYLANGGYTLDMENLVLSRYFSSLSTIRSRTDEELSIRMVAYLLLYFQFVQLMFYFSFHPRMGILTATIEKAWSGLCHFFSLFALLFCMLGFMAHWMLGTHVAEFESYGMTLQSQARMLFGEFIYAESADDLDGMMIAMYWVYAFTFMLVVFFTLLNFFLAIIVDAFADVKDDEEKDLTEHDFATDSFDAIVSFWAYRANPWPERHKVITVLRERRQALDRHYHREMHQLMEVTVEATKAIEAAREEASKMPCLEFGKLFDNELGNRNELAHYLRYYYLKVPAILVKRHHNKNHKATRLNSRVTSLEGGPSKSGTSAAMSDHASRASSRGQASSQPPPSRNPSAPLSDGMQASVPSSMGQQQQLSTTSPAISIPVPEDVEDGMAPDMSSSVSATSDIRHGLELLLKGIGDRDDDEESDDDGYFDEVGLLLSKAFRLAARRYYRGGSQPIQERDDSSGLTASVPGSDPKALKRLHRGASRSVSPSSDRPILKNPVMLKEPLPLITRGASSLFWENFGEESEVQKDDVVKRNKL